MIETPRLRLRRAAPHDLAALHALWRHPEVHRYLFDDVAPDEATARAVLQACLDVADRGLGLWLATPHDASTLVGCAGLLPAGAGADHEPRLAGHVEVLVALDPAYWGQGHATACLSALVRHAFDGLGLVALAAVNDVPNVASARMLARAGFVTLSEVDGPRYRMTTYLLEARRWRERENERASRH